jgi:DNA mismatch repair protein MutS2
LRVDDAVSMATSFLDRAFGDGTRVAFLIHGHGTGALRDAVRKELARTSYVTNFRSAEPDQGGDGVTVVWLS